MNLIYKLSYYHFKLGRGAGKDQNLEAKKKWKRVEISGQPENPVRIHDDEAQRNHLQEDKQGIFLVF